MSNSQKIALELVNAKIYVFPANPNKKPCIKDWKNEATTDPLTIKFWWKKFPNAIPAIPTGMKNGFSVLDVDFKNGKDGFKTLKTAGHDVNELSSFRVNTPSGGAHFYFKHPEGLTNSTAGLPVGVDVRAEGGYVIAPGAATRVGKYESVGPSIVGNVGKLPNWPKELRHKEPPNHTSSTRTQVSFKIIKSALLAIPNTSSKRDWWLSIGASLHQGTSGSAKGLRLFHKWSALYDGYNEANTNQLWRSLKRTKGNLITVNTILQEAANNGWQSPRIVEMFEILEIDPKEFVADEDGVIRAFTAKYKDQLKYNHTTRDWFVFKKHTWKQEGTKLALHFARELSTLIAESNPKAKSLKRVNSWESIERGAKPVREFATVSTDWNKNPFLLGTPEGTVDLTTGIIKRGNSSDLISRSTSIGPIPLDRFNPKNDCPLWIKFLREALGNDRGLIRFLQQWFGYSLTSETKEQSLLFIYGIGGGGKSTVLNAIAEIMGEYSININTSTLTAKKHDSHSEDLARLNGPRMVWASETEQGKKWSETRIKSLTGGDTVTARFMRQNSFEFTPQFKLVVVGNNQPSLSTVDEAMKRRLLILPFNHPPKRKDADLSEKLRTEYAGILSWLIQGCLDWAKNGLIIPDAMKQATESYFDQQDSGKRWLEDCCIIGNEESDTIANLYASWVDYANSIGEYSGAGIKSFSERMQQMGFKRIKDTNGIRGRGFLGISVKIDFDNLDDKSNGFKTSEISKHSTDGLF